MRSATTATATAETRIAMSHLPRQLPAITIAGSGEDDLLRVREERDED